MLRIAVQSKGRLFEDTMTLLAEADIKLSTSKRTLLTQSSNFPVEVLFLRDDDIPQCVASGVADLGIVGENEFVERAEEADIAYRLGFSKCRLSLAIPKETEYNGPEWFNGKKIATSYPGILQSYLEKNQIKADIHVITGSVGNCSGNRTGRCNLRYRKFRIYPHQQQPERSGSGDEKRSPAHCQQAAQRREAGNPERTDLPHTGRTGS